MEIPYLDPPPLKKWLPLLKPLRSAKGYSLVYNESLGIVYLVFFDSKGQAHTMVEMGTLEMLKGFLNDADKKVWQFEHGEA